MVGHIVLPHVDYCLNRILYRKSPSGLAATDRLVSSDSTLHSAKAWPVFQLWWVSQAGVAVTGCSFAKKCMAWTCLRQRRMAAVLRAPRCRCVPHELDVLLCAGLQHMPTCPQFCNVTLLNTQ